MDIGQFKRLLVSAIAARLISNFIIGRKFELEADRFAFKNGKAKGLLDFFSRKKEKYNEWIDNDPEYIAVEKDLEKSKIEALEAKKYKDFIKIKLAKGCLISLKGIFNGALAITRGLDWVQEKTFWDPHPSLASRIKSAEEYLSKKKLA